MVSVYAPPGYETGQPASWIWTGQPAGGGQGEANTSGDAFGHVQREIKVAGNAPAPANGADIAAIEKERMTAMKPLVVGKYRVATDCNHRGIRVGEGRSFRC